MRIKRRILALVFTVAVVIGSGLPMTGSAASQTPMLDETFGEGGVSRAATFSSDNWPLRTLTLPDGRIITIGYANAPTLVRYTANGQIDPSFGLEGKLQIEKMPNGKGGSFSGGIVQKDGKILVIGSQNKWATNETGYELVWMVLRLTADGQFDQSFGMGGMVLAPTGVDATATDIAVQQDGKIVLTGFQRTAGGEGRRVLVQRLNGNGSLDDGFGLNGRINIATHPDAAYNYGQPEDAGNVVRILPDGKILVHGTADAAINGFRNRPTFVARLNTNGTLDAGFGKNGVTFIESEIYLNAYDMEIQSDGKIVVAGGRSAAHLSRLQPNGSLDTSFHIYEDYGGTFVLQPDNKIIISTRDQSTPLLKRYTTSGGLDQSFGNNGTYIYPVQMPLNTDISLVDGSLLTFGSMLAEDKHAWTVARLLLPDAPSQPGKHETGFWPDIHGFGFQNYGGQLSWDTFEQFFGAAEVLADNGERLAYAQAYYDSSYKNSADGGLCFGFSGASMINFKKLNQAAAGSFAVKENGKYYSVLNPATFYNAQTPKRNLTESLMYYHGVQKDVDAQKLLLERSLDARANYAVVKQSLQSGTPMQVAIFRAFQRADKTWGSEGHSLAAYRYEEKNGSADVYVYDSNHPGATDKKMTFNLTANSWEYDPHDANGIWKSSLKGSRLAVMPTTMYIQEGDLPTDQTRRLVLPRNVAAFITDAAGGSTGSVGTEYAENAKGVDVLPDILASETAGSQTFVVADGQPYTLQAKGQANTSEQPITIFGKGMAMIVKGALHANATTQIALAANGKAASLSTDTAMANYSVEISQEVARRSHVFTLSGTSLLPGENIRLELLNDTGRLAIRNDSKQAKTYTLNMREVGGNSSSHEATNITVQPNMTQVWQPSDWNRLGSAAITREEDANSDGTIDNTVVLNTVTINDGSAYAKNQNVTLRLAIPTGATRMRIDVKPFSAHSKAPHWRPVAAAVPWKLTSGNGQKTVYVQFMSGTSKSAIHTASIVLDDKAPELRWADLGNFRLLTASPTIKLHLQAQDKTSGISQMKVSNSLNMQNASWQPYQQVFQWQLLPTKRKTPELRTVYIQLRDTAGNVSSTQKVLLILWPER